MSDPASVIPAAEIHANENAAPPPPNKDEIREFLSLFQQPSGWAIALLGKSMGTRYFTDLNEAVDYAYMGNKAGRSTYLIPANFHVPANATKNPKDSDIYSSDFLWVDIDPEGAGDIQAERERILRRIIDGLPPGVPPPTGVICSGNGFQLFWKLRTAVTPEELVAKNKWLIAKLGGDKSAFNPARLMRVAGTTNFPSATKLKKGRKPERAFIVSWDHSLMHEAGIFHLAETTPTAQKTSGKKAAFVATPLSQTEFEHLALSGELRALIISGDDVNNPGRFGDRSKAVWHACREMAKSGLDDQTIYSIITDPNFRISDHILDQTNPDYAARRTIPRARESVEDPVLAEMNAKHAVIGYVGSKCMVTVEVSSPNDPKGKILRLQSFTEFCNAYMNKYVELKDGKRTSMGGWWLAHPQHRQYETLVFCPGEPEEVGDSLNLWTGFAVEPRPGDWSKFHQHIVDVLADGNEKHADYILRWIAWMVQNPGRRAEVALVLKGGKGTGKGTFGSALKALFGQHGIQVSSAKQIAGDFNAHLRSTVFLFADEAYFAGSKADEGTLKRMLTEETLLIEAKGRDCEEVPNCLHVLMASNNEWVVPASFDERRFAVFDVSPKHAQDEAYFREINAELASGGLEAFLHDMLAMDLGDWHPRRIPRTHALLDQKLSSLSPTQEWVYGLLMEGRLSCSTTERPDFATSANLYMNARRTNPRIKDLSDIKLSKALKDFGVTDGWSGKQRGKKFPPLPEMRAAFEKRIGGQIEWGGTNADGQWEADAPSLGDLPY